MVAADDWADIFAEPWLALPDKIHCIKRQKDHKPRQNQVFEKFQPAISWNFSELFGKWDFVEKVLYQSERAKPATDKPSQNRPEQQEKTRNIKCKFVVSIRKHSLKGTDWAGTKRSWAGITIQTGDTKGLCLSCVNLTTKKSCQIAIC